MALFLLYAKNGGRNASGINAVLVDAADESSARTAAAAAAPTETKVPASWVAVSLAATATLPEGRTVVWIEGVVASLLGKTRGGETVGIQ